MSKSEDRRIAIQKKTKAQEVDNVITPLSRVCGNCDLVYIFNDPSDKSVGEFLDRISASENGSSIGSSDELFCSARCRAEGA
ncbi:hypothetical protein CMI47_19350 [Candidatus Pacearchaeota archaeon]|nr:hypothetical protein [Candidatus Pacearchaeota archaeon]|tara:strand:- start:460 stop:705 length:246 start_codon:yes stop_codon:yes gene_type:complete